MSPNVVYFTVLPDTQLIGWQKASSVDNDNHIRIKTCHHIDDGEIDCWKSYKDNEYCLKNSQFTLYIGKSLIFYIFYFRFRERLIILRRFFHAISYRVELNHKVTYLECCKLLSYFDNIMTDSVQIS